MKEKIDNKIELIEKSAIGSALYMVWSPEGLHRDGFVLSNNTD